MQHPLIYPFERIPESGEDHAREHVLYYDAVCDCVISEWRGFVSKKSLITGATQSLQLLAKHQCTNLLINHQFIHGTWADLSDWQINIWLPNALQAGLKKYALVACTGSYSALSSEMAFARLSSDLEMMIFSDLQDARGWLSGY